MSKLEDAARAMLAMPEEALTDPQARFIEVLTFSSFDEIVGVLDRSLGGEFFALPVWARNLAHRLACLQAPTNVDFLRRAAGDLRLFGPDWDDVADELYRRASSLEAGVEDDVTRRGA